jgi:23S rRNA (uracil1939-C5)-methyltransferase
LFVNAGEAVVAVAAGGEGVTANGRRIALAAPGDEVAADGAILPGPHHAAPPCRHFPECGGCQLQHVDDDAYADFLRDGIAAALTGQGLDLPVMRHPHISPPVSRRRAALSAQRQGGRVMLGFKAEKGNRIVDMRECFILRPELFALVEPVRRLLATMLPNRGTGSVRMTVADQGVDLLLEKVVAEGLAAAEALSDFAGTHRLARLVIDEGDGAQTRWEPEPVTVTFGEVPVSLPPKAFLQATKEGEAVLGEAVLDAVGPATAVADLFAGLGTFALATAGRVYAAESDRDAALALRAAGARSQRLLWVEPRYLFQRPLDRKELDRFEAVIRDPPRAGAREQVAEIAGSAVPRVAYVSCNPVSFARDAAVLAAGGYRLQWVQPVGQFRWSTHVELLGAFAR